MKLSEAKYAIDWMRSKGWKPQVFQLAAWNAMASGEEGIVNAPTGSGKTYSIMLPFFHAVHR